MSPQLNNKTAATDEGLKRELGAIDIAASVINITIGSGIFLLPALVAAILGPASVLAYLICGVLYFCIILCFAEMSSRIKDTGGSYVYIEKAFGPFAGFIANNLLWLSGVLICAALVNGIADLLSVSFPVFDQQLYRILLFILLIGYCCYSNITGIKQSMRTAKILTILKLLPLVLIVIVGLFQLNFNNLKWHGVPGTNELGGACLLLFAAFIGGESAAILGGEMKNPKKTGPLGLLAGVAGVIIFYILIQLVAQSTLGNKLAAEKAPLATVAGIELGGWGMKLLLIGGLVSIFGTLFSCIMAFSRVMFAGAFNNLLPKFLEKVHPKYATPHRAIICISLFAIILACTGGYRYLIVVATISMMLSYVGVAFALIKFKLQKEKVTDANQGFRLPGGIAIPVLALIALGWFLWHSKKEEIVGLGIFIAVLIIVYVIKLLFAPKPSNQV
jgi:APA family basic amino acid/polyamine antiporter